MKCSSPFAWPLVLLLVWASAGSTASAGNGDAILQGPDAALTGGAVTATTDDAIAVYYNPAGLALIQRGQVSASAQAIQLTRLRIADLLSVQGGPSVDGEILVMPMLPAGTSAGGKLAEGLGWGAGIFSSNQLAYTLRGVLDFQGRSGPASLSIVSEQIVINTVGAVGIGWAALPNLRIGAALTGHYNELYGAFLLNAGDVTADPAMPTDEGNLAGFSSSFGRQTAGLGMRAGVQWEPDPSVVIGVAAWSPSFQIFETRGQTTAQLSRNDGGTRYVPINDSTTEWGFRPAAGWRVRGGIAYRASWGWVSIDGDITTPYRDRMRRVDEIFRWNLRAGAHLRLSDTMAFGAGLFTDRHAIAQDDNPTFSPRVHLYGGTLGVDFDSTRSLAPDEPSPDIRFQSGLGLRLAYGRGDFSTFSLDENFNAEPSLVRATMLEVGVYLTAGLYL